MFLSLIFQWKRFTGSSPELLQQLQHFKLLEILEALACELTNTAYPGFQEPATITCAKVTHGFCSATRHEQSQYIN
jgi:hypothetical protein